MSANFSMLNGIFSFIEDFLTGIFAFIPQMMYFVYTCSSSILDFFQWVLRKLAGLDVYYINGEAQQGDIVLSIIKGILGIEQNSGNGQAYSTLSTVFWSLVIFGVIILVLSTIIKLITTHYNYNPESSKPSTIIKASIKSLLTMAIIPIVTIFGIEISNALLKTLDQISSSSSSISMSSVYKTSANKYNDYFESGEDSWGNTTYSSYDAFSFGSYTNMTSISGELFKVSANTANRVRKGTYTPHQNGAGDQWSSFGIFNSTSSDIETRREEVAYMIDYAFANNLTFKDRKTASVLMGESIVLVSSFKFMQSAVWYIGTIQFKNFSKYNVGLVWYYYNLWHFNYFIAFAGFGVALSLLTSIVFGLISRLINVIALFLVYPALVGIGPLKNDATSSWKSEFIGNILMAYGAVIGMNLCFMILPSLQSVSFFNSRVPDTIFNTIIMLAALLSVKKIIQTFSQIIGAKDAAAEGEGVKEEVKKASFATAEKTMKAAQLAVKVAKVVYTGGASLALEAAKAIAKKKAKKELMKKIQEKIQKKKIEDLKKGAAKQKEEDKKEAEKDPSEKMKAGEALDPNDIIGKSDEEQEKIWKEKHPGQEYPGKEKHDEEDEEDFTSRKADEALALEDELRNALLHNKTFNAKQFGDESENAQKQYDWLKQKIADDLANYQKQKEESGDGQLYDDEIARKEQEFFEDRIATAQKRYLEDSADMGDMAEQKAGREKEEKQEAKAQARAEKREKLKKKMGWVKKPANFVKKLLPWSDIANGALEITAKSIKVVGSVSGTSAIGGELKNGGVFDIGKSIMKDFGQTLNIDVSKIETKQDEDNRKKADKTAYAENLGTTYSYSKAAADQIDELKDIVKDLRKNYKPQTKKGKK